MYKQVRIYTHVRSVTVILLTANILQVILIFALLSDLSNLSLGFISKW